MQTFKKIIAIALVLITVITTISSLSVYAAAEDNPSRYAVEITAPEDGEIVDAEESFKIRWNRCRDSKFYRYWVTIREIQGDYAGDKIVNKAVSTNYLKIKAGELEPGKTYKLYVAYQDKNGSVLNTGSAWQVYYFSTKGVNSMLGYFPEMSNIAHSKYVVMEDNSRISFNAEYIAPGKSLKIRWNTPKSGYDKYDIKVEYLGVTNAPVTVDEDDIVTVCDKTTSREYYTINKRYLVDQAFLRVTLKGKNQNGSYSPTMTYYLFVGKNNNLIAYSDVFNTAIENGIDLDSNTYKALESINARYAYDFSTAEKKGTLIFMFEGVGNYSSSSKRMNAMCVVVQDGKISYINPNSSTIPDYPFDPSRNDDTDMPTLKSGIYSFTTVNHGGSYAALKVSNAKVLRFSSKSNFYSSTSTGINIHRRSTNDIAPQNATWANSSGCILIGKSGTSSSSEYAKFIQTIGIVGSNAKGNAKYSTKVTGKIIVDRTYAADYLKSVGYSTSAIKALG